MMIPALYRRKPKLQSETLFSETKVNKTDAPVPQAGSPPTRPEFLPSRGQVCDDAAGIQSR